MGKANIKKLKDQFSAAQFEMNNQGQGKAFAAGDVQDVYALDKAEHASMPRKLDTLTRNHLKAKTSGGA